MSAADSLRTAVVVALTTALLSISAVSTAVAEEPTVTVPLAGSTIGVPGPWDE